MGKEFSEGKSFWIKKEVDLSILIWMGEWIFGISVLAGFFIHYGFFCFWIVDLIFWIIGITKILKIKFLSEECLRLLKKHEKRNYLKRIKECTNILWKLKIVAILLPILSWALFPIYFLIWESSRNLGKIYINKAIQAQALKYPIRPDLLVKKK